MSCREIRSPGRLSSAPEHTYPLVHRGVPDMAPDGTPVSYFVCRAIRGRMQPEHGMTYCGSLAAAQETLKEFRLRRPMHEWCIVAQTLRQVPEEVDA